MTNKTKGLYKQAEKDEGKVQGLGERGHEWTEQLSSEPKASIFHNFLSKEECEYLINLAKPRLVRARVKDRKTGKVVNSSTRTSHGAFLKRGEDRVVRAIEQRIADYTQIPYENGEGMQVLHYSVGQKHDPHFDYATTGSNERGGPRMATLLMYLSDVEEGGETVFPNGKRLSCVCCCNEPSTGGISVTPKMGDALLFWSMCPDGTRDPSSYHAAKAVIKGEKWSCTKWMHVSARR